MGLYFTCVRRSLKVGLLGVCPWVCVCVRVCFYLSDKGTIDAVEGEMAIVTSAIGSDTDRDGGV